jgi:predicted transcriptional regulator
MATVISVEIPDDVRTALDQAVNSTHRTQADLVQEALRDYLFGQKFRNLRESMQAKARKQGIETDQDVFDRVS